MGRENNYRKTSSEKFSLEYIAVNGASALGLVHINNLTQLNSVSKLIPARKAITLKPI